MEESFLSCHSYLTYSSIYIHLPGVETRKRNWATAVKRVLVRMYSPDITNRPEVSEKVIILKDLLDEVRKGIK